MRPSKRGLGLGLGLCPRESDEGWQTGIFSRVWPSGEPFPFSESRIYGGVASDSVSLTLLCFASLCAIATEQSLNAAITQRHSSSAAAPPQPPRPPPPPTERAWDATQRKPKTTLRELSRISIFYFFLSLSPAGESGIDVFAREADRRNICIAIAEKVPSDADEKTFSEVSKATRFVPKLQTRQLLHSYCHETLLRIPPQRSGGTDEKPPPTPPPPRLTPD